MRKHYLQTIGIVSWRSRLVSNENPTCYRYELYDNERQVGLLIADAILHTAEEQKLIEAIAAATKKRTVGGLRQSDSSLLNEKTVVIALGSQVSRWLRSRVELSSFQFIESFSPAELLTDSRLKVQVWNAIKQALKLMG